METINYSDLKREYKNMENKERVDKRFNTKSKEPKDFVKNDKRYNLDTKQEFWEYLAKCPIK